MSTLLLFVVWNAPIPAGDAQSTKTGMIFVLLWTPGVGLAQSAAALHEAEHHH